MVHQNTKITYYLTRYLILAGDGRLNIYHDYAQQLVRWTELMIELLEGMEVNLLFIYKTICEFKWFINIKILPE